MEQQALEQFERLNGVKYYEKDKLLEWNQARRNQVCDERPWKKDPYYFKTCHISVIAMLKMLLHAKKGEPNEVMGILIGQTIGRDFVITDVVSLGVEGTETRVNASADSDEYAINYREYLESNGYAEAQAQSGWYHTHPSYKCWLSSIDCATQRTQQLMDPAVAIVVDPTTTTNNGHIEIGAFRTFPNDFVPKANENDKKILPLEKIADFGSCYDKYYTLDVKIFKTELDQRMLEKLWHEYWCTTLSATPIIENREMMEKKIIDFAEKFSLKRKANMTVKETCSDLRNEIQEIQMIYQRGLQSIQFKNLLFNTKF